MDQLLFRQCLLIILFSLQELIDNLLTKETSTHIYNLMSTPEFEDTATDLNSIGVPIADIINYIEQLIIKFFDLDNKLSE